MLVDYDFYVSNYLQGTQASIDEASFPFLAKKAELMLKQVTHGGYMRYVVDGKLTEDAIKECLCAIAESINKEEKYKAGGVAVASESVGNHSISYAVAKSGDFTRERFDIFKLYLLEYGLLSRKVYGYEG